MKKWFKFFSLSFFSHKWAKEGAKRGYSNFFLSFVLVLVFLWAGFIGSDMLPFSAHYNNAPDFQAIVRSVFANPDLNKRIVIEVENGTLKMKKQGDAYTECLLVNTFENDLNKRDYSVDGYEVIVDTRPANALAEIRAYCVSNDGKNLIISYEEYLTLSEVARLNFDFKLEYTGLELELDDEKVEGYREYLNGLNDETKLTIEKMALDLTAGKIMKDEYNRGVYELYFVNYYPEISEYEASSKVPLLRNYYYHKYLKEGNSKYLFVFDDYMAGSFITESGIDVTFYGFYNNLENGILVSDDMKQGRANEAVDSFIMKSFNSISFLNAYAYAINVFSLIPFIALMPMVVTLLAYSLLKLRNVDTIKSLGGTFKIIGSFMWASGILAGAIAIISAFFVPRNVITTLPLILFFVILVIRAIVFAVTEARLYTKQLEQLEVEEV